MASSTADAMACTRVSIAALGSIVGEITRQLSAFTSPCHCSASAASTTATAGCFSAAAAANRLLVAQARANFLGQFLNVFGLLQGRHREDKAVLLLEILLELLRQL